MQTHNLQRVAAPWASLPRCKNDRSTSTKWALLWGLYSVHSAGYDGESLISSLLHVVGSHNKLHPLVSSLQKELISRSTALDTETRQSLMDQFNNAASSSSSSGSGTPATPAARTLGPLSLLSPAANSSPLINPLLASDEQTKKIIRTAFKGMVRILFPNMASNCSDVSSLLIGYLSTITATSECKTLSELHTRLDKVYNTLKWVWTFLAKLDEDQVKPCQGVVANNCRLILLSHMDANTKSVISLHLGSVGNDDIKRWEKLEKTIESGGFQDKPLATPDPSGVLAGSHPVLLSASAAATYPPLPPGPPPGEALTLPLPFEPISSSVPTDTLLPAAATIPDARLLSMDAKLSSVMALLGSSQSSSNQSSRDHRSSRDRSHDHSRRGRSRSRSPPSSSSRSRSWSRTYRRRSRTPPRRYERDNNSRTPDKRSKIPCRDYSRGSCSRGASCRFSHKNSTPSPSTATRNTNPSTFRKVTSNASSGTPQACNYAARGVNCPFQPNCKFSHDVKPALTMAVVSAPSNPSPAQNDATLKQLHAISSQLSTLASSGVAQQKQLDTVSSYVNSQQAQLKEQANREQTRAQAMAMFQHLQQAQKLQQQQPSQPSGPLGPSGNPLLLPPPASNALVTYNPYQSQIN